MISKAWVAIENHHDPQHAFHDLEFSSTITPLRIYARVFWKSTFNYEGWYYRFPTKDAYGVYGPFKTESDAMTECNEKIKRDIAGLVERFGGLE